MPNEVKSGSKSIEGTLDTGSYPSSVDVDAVGSSTQSEGSENSLPENSPIPGADGSLPLSRISKVQ